MIWGLEVTIILTYNKFDQKKGNLIYIGLRPGYYLQTGESKLLQIWRKDFLFVLEKPAGR